MKIAIGCDHGGFDLKPDVIEFLKSRSIEVIDLGTNSSESVDYPDYGRAVGEAVASKKADLGIVICGTGIGISLAANKVRGIRAAVVSDTFSAKMARAHNNANILAFGARVVGKGLAIEIVKAWLDTDFEGGRHQRRVDKIMNIEN
ncbi:MAG: ribose 5-phosphate isomerase B [Bacillota bacterium]|nr:ribose 5-phosphate isomerase B [Bacillota bacterium]